jgi:hypothetical protein
MGGVHRDSMGSVRRVGVMSDKAFARILTGVLIFIIAMAGAHIIRAAYVAISF